MTADGATPAITGTRTAELVAWARLLSLADIPADVISTAKLAIADNVGCMLAGATTRLAATTRAALLGPAADPGTMVVGNAQRASAPLAAFLNAVSANALDYDDAYERGGKGMGHPGSTLIPTALAMGEHFGRSGEEVLTAVIAGYEVTNRIIEAIQPTPDRHAAVWGVAVHQGLGSAIVASRLAGLSTAGTLDAVGLAGMFATVPAARKWNWDRRPLAWAKDMVAAPAEAGVRSALLAAQGYVGSRDILDGEQGFWIMAGSDQCDPDRLIAGLGERWTVRHLVLKPYPACRWIHTSLEATEQLIVGHGLGPGDIARVQVDSFRDLVEHFADPEPVSMVDAEFSVPYTVAVMIHGLPPGAPWYRDETLRDPRILATARKVFLSVDDEAQARHFRLQRQTMAVVTITDRQGQNYSRRIAVARGDVQAADTPVRMEHKFVVLASETGRGASAGALWTTLMDLESIPDIRHLRHILGEVSSPATNIR